MTALVTYLLTAVLVIYLLRLVAERASGFMPRAHCVYALIASKVMHTCITVCTVYVIRMIFVCLMSEARSRKCESKERVVWPKVQIEGYIAARSVSSFFVYCGHR